MYAKIVAIGTSKGIRLPKYLIDKYHFENVVEVDDTENGLLLRPNRQSRAGWEVAFKATVNSDQNSLIEMPDSEWDEKEWEW